MNNPDTLFEKHAEAIRNLPSGELPRDLLKSDAFLLERAGSLAVYYAPLDYVNRQAKLAILGITPGWTQMERAFRDARKPALQGMGREDVCRIAKENASFGGTMRPNLLGMLDQLDLEAALGIPSAADLFGSSRNLLHTTSVIRYPAFVDGENYSGKSPRILRHSVLKEYVAPLARDLSEIPEALVIPLGDRVAEVMVELVKRGEIAEERVLFGFPHPSGSNGHRHTKFAEQREPMREHIRHWFSRN
jgi:hypothetical protein